MCRFCSDILRQLTPEPTKHHCPITDPNRVPINTNSGALLKFAWIIAELTFIGFIWLISLSVGMAIKDHTVEVVVCFDVGLLMPRGIEEGY
jgi:hypothetical protein